MLAQLQRVHDELLQALAALEAETARPAPDQATLSAARLAIVRVTSRRRSLIDCTICPTLHDVSPDEARRMQDIRSEAARMAVESSGHITRWTIANIVADWEGYRLSSTALRAVMRKRIADENSLLYTLLEARAANSSGAAAPMLARKAS